MKTIILTVCLAIIALPALGFAEDGKGGQPAAFRDLKLGGRPAAMGGAFTAIAEGGVGNLYNPAGPSQMRQHEASLAYRAMKLDRRLGFASFSIPAKEDATLTFSWIYAGTADLDARDVQGNIIEGEAFSQSENMVSVNFAKKFIPQLYLGGKAFYVQNNIGNINAYTVGIDLGVLTRLDIRKSPVGKYFPLLMGGLTVENLGATYKWTTTEYWRTLGRDRGSSVDEKFPINYRLGAALSQPMQYTLAADVEMNSASMSKSHFGGEYNIGRTLALRAGLDNLHPTFGIGFLKRFQNFAMWVDISYLTDKVGEGDDILASFDIMF